MNVRKPFHTYFFLWLLLLILPALACATLFGSDTDSEPTEDAIQVETIDAQEALSDTDQADADGDAADTVGEDVAGPAPSPEDAEETIIGALRSGLEVDAMRLHVTTEDVSSGQTTDITLAFVRPDRYHMTSQGLEIIVIEDTTYLKGPDGQWTTVPGTEMISTVEESLAAFAGEVAVQEQLDTLSGGEVTFEGTETINGIETLLYSIDEGLAGTAISGHVRMWIGAADGLLYRQEVESDIGGVATRLTMDIEYGADVTIEPPE